MPTRPDDIRVLHRLAGTADSWQEAPHFRSYLGGLRLLWYVRRALPDYGEAELEWVSGYMETGGAAKMAGASGTTDLGHWDPDTDQLAIPDLAGHEIRIQRAPHQYQDETLAGAQAWRTVWHGVIAYVTPEHPPAGQYPMGSIRYRAVDALAWWTRRWYLDRHGLHVGATARGDLDGHPGWNCDREGNLVPTRDTSGGTWALNGASLTYHVHPGDDSDADYWSDAHVLADALRAGRRSAFAPLYDLRGATDLLSGVAAWRVVAGMRVWDVLADVCRPNRCLVVAYYDWSDDSGAPTGELDAGLAMSARSYTDIIYDPPGGGAMVTITGALSRGTAVDINVIGDRQVAGWSLAQRSQYVADYIETLGGSIVVAWTAGHIDGTLSAGWEPTEADARNSADDPGAPRYRPVYALHQVPYDWDGRAGDGNGGSLTSALYQCADDGAITGAAAGSVSSLLLRQLRELPLLEGVNYDIDPPERYDGASHYGGVSFRRPEVFLRLDTDSYVDAVEAAGAVVRVTPEGLWVESEDIGDPGEGVGTYAWYDVVVTQAVEIPDALRLATGSADGTHHRMAFPELQVHMVHAGAIIDLGTANGDGFSAVRRESSPIVRDDRDRLAYYHALHVAWHGTERRPLRYARRFHGVEDGGPQLGQVIADAKAGGETHYVRTPVVEVGYHHEQVQDWWVTEWHGIDIRRAAGGGI